MKFGIGYDIHRLEPDRDLIIGGVSIPYQQGLLGHSDADVLLHAISDALLGAAALGDIGQHFPDTSELYHNANSLDLLKKVVAKLEAKNLKPHNVDSIIIAEAPKMAPFIPQMCKNIAQALNIKINMANVKATTSEGLGPVGEKLGIAAYAIASIDYIK